MAFVDKAHVLTDGMIDFWLLVDYALDSLQISAVSILLIESGSYSSVCGAVVVECPLHLEEL